VREAATYTAYTRVFHDVAAVGWVKPSRLQWWNAKKKKPP